MKQRVIGLLTLGILALVAVPAAWAADDPPPAPPPPPGTVRPVVRTTTVPAPCVVPSRPALPQQTWRAAPLRRKRPSSWAFRLEGILTWLESPTGLVGPSSADPAQLRWDDVNYDAAWGTRVTVAWSCSPCWRLVGMAAWHTRNRTACDQRTGSLGYQQTPSSPVLSTPATNAYLHATPELASGEIHAWRTLSQSRCLAWDVGLGFRYVGFDESAGVHFDQTLPQATNPASAHSDVTNRFLGGQVGGMVRYQPSRCWTVFASAKGLLGAIEREVRVWDESVFAAGSHSAFTEDTPFGWGVDFEIGVDWRFHRCWSLGVSYQLLLLGEVVRGTDAFDFSQAATGAVQARQATTELLTQAIFFGVTWHP